MTAYFDLKHGEVHVIETKLAARGVRDPWSGVAEDRALLSALDVIDRTVVWDASICGEQEGFPADLRERIQQVILRRSIEGQPLNARGIEIETLAERIETLNMLIHDLHTVFHDVSSRRIGCFTDSPMAPMRMFAGRAEELREKLAAVDNPYELWRTGAMTVLFRAANVHLVPMLGSGAEKIASYAVASLEEAIRAQHGLTEPVDMEAAADAERAKIAEICAAHDARQP